MEQSTNEPDKKKVNEDMVVFMRKRSDHEAPRYTARLKTYVDIQRKRRRAATARRNSEHSYAEKPTSPSGVRKKDEQKDKTENGEETSHQEHDNDGHGNSEDEELGRGRKGWFGRRGGEEKTARGRSITRSRSDADPSDACCRRRRRRRRGCRRRRRRRGSRRRRRRRRSCRRRRRRRSSRRRRRRRC